MAKPEEEIKQGLELLAEEVRQHGGLPDPSENPRFYARLLNLLDLAKEVGVKLSISKVAEVLGVGYAPLRKRIKEYKELEMAGEDAAEVEIIEPQPEPEPPKPEPAKAGGEEKPREERRSGKKRGGKAATTRTEENIHSAAVKRLSKRAEDLVKEEVEKIIEIGSMIVEQYQGLCYASGFDSLEECVEAAFTALTEVYPRLKELEDRYEACKDALKVALKLSDRYLATLYLLDAASKSIKTPEQLELIRRLEEVLGDA